MKKLLIIALSFTLYSNSYSQVNWVSMEEAQELSKKEPRKIIVKLYTSWCGWCGKMDKDTFAKKKIYEYINKKYYAVKFDGEYKGDVNFNGKVYKFKKKGKRGHNELTEKLTNNKLSYPSNSFINEQNQIISVIPGYHKPKDFLPMLKYIGEDLYRKISWEDYKKIIDDCQNSL